MTDLAFRYLQAQNTEQKTRHGAFLGLHMEFSSLSPYSSRTRVTQVNSRLDGHVPRDPLPGRPELSLEYLLRYVHCEARPIARILKLSRKEEGEPIWLANAHSPCQLPAIRLRF